MSAPRPYVPRRDGDPIVASDWRRVMEAHQAAIQDHDHQDGRGALLTGESFDPNTDLTVAAVSTDTLIVDGQDVGARLAETLPVTGGMITGDLEVGGALVMNGRLLVGAGVAVAASGGAAGPLSQPDMVAREVAELMVGSDDGWRLFSVLTLVPEADLDLDLAYDSVLLVQAVGGFVGGLGDDSTRVELEFERSARLALWAERDGKRAWVAGLGATEGETDIDARIAASTGAPLEVVFATGSVDFLRGYASATTVQRPVAHAWLLRGRAGPLRLGLAVCGRGTFTELNLSVTTLPELCHV